MKENKENKNEEKYYTVYKHISPSGKCYIGITCQNPPEKRWANGYGYYRNTYFWNAIQKYGWSNFKHEILFEGLTKKEAEEKEIELIAYYKSNQSDFGYNISNGGNCVGTHTEESKKKMSEHAYEKSRVFQFDIDGNFINEYESIKKAYMETGVTRQNIVACCNNRMKTAGGFIWRYSFDELTIEHIVWCNKSKKKNTELKQKKKESLKLQSDFDKTIVQYTFSGEIIGEFKNITIAEEKTGVHKSNISKCCKGKARSAGGYIWKYKSDKFVEFGLYNYTRKTNKPIVQYTKNGELVQQYGSIIEASMVNNIDQSSITKCCKGKLQSAGGYVWEYINKENVETKLNKIF